MKKRNSRNSTPANPETTSGRLRRCNYCGRQAPMVWIHGHGQCARCGINVEECCRGERCNPAG